MQLTAHSKRSLFLGGKLKTGVAQVYTAEGSFATNKDSGGSLKIKKAVGSVPTSARVRVTASSKRVR